MENMLLYYVFYVTLPGSGGTYIGLFALPGLFAFSRNITKSSSAFPAAFRGARGSRMDRANPSFAALFPVFHAPFPLQAARPADKYIFPESGGVSKGKRPPPLRGNVPAERRAERQGEKP